MLLPPIPGSKAERRRRVAADSRASNNFGGFRKRLEGAGKRPKAAIIATARKLLVALNAMIAIGQKYAHQVTI
jgi:transposase